MQYLKIFIFVCMCIALALPREGVAQRLSPEQFWEEFVTAFQVSDAERIQHLITVNPTTANQVQQHLRELGKRTGEEVEQYRAIAEVFEKFCSGDFSLILDSWQEEGKQSYYTANYATALERFQAGLNQARVLNDERYIGDFLTSIGVVYAALGQYQHALEYYEQALTINRDLDDRRGEGVNLTNIGNIYADLGQYQQALKHHEQALVIRREFSDRRREGDTLTNIGTVYADLGQYQQALTYHEQALTIHRNFNDRREEGRALTNIGSVYAHLGQYQKALTYYEQALTIKGEINDQHGEGDTLTNIANVYADLGQYQRSLSYYEQVLEIHRGIGARHGEGLDLTNIGLVYANLGQYQRALDYYDQALTIRREIGNRLGEGLILTNIGNVFSNLGQSQRALQCHEQALMIAREFDNHPMEGAALINIGIEYRDLEQYQKALEAFQQALTIHREIGNRNWEKSALGNIGHVYGTLGQYQRTLEYYQHALRISLEIEDQQGEATTLVNMGLLYAVHLEQYQEAYTAFQGSISINEALGTLDSLWRAQFGLAFVEVYLNQQESAIIHYEQALDTIEALRAGLAEKEQKLSFMQDKLFVYDELIDLLQDLHQKNPDKGYDRRALEIFERKQGRVFLEEMGQSGARVFAGIPGALLQNEFDLETRLEQIRKQLVDERSKIITEQNKELIQTLEERENTLKAEQAALQEQIKIDYPDYYALRYPKPVALADLQQQVLQPGELMLVYGVMEEKTLLWVISSNTPLPPSRGDFRMYNLSVSEEDLQQKVTELRESWKYEYQWGIQRGLVQEADLEAGQKTPASQLSHALYTLLIPEEIRPLLTEAHTLNVVPTGPLYALPFETLVTEPPNPHPSPLPKGEGVHSPLLVGEGSGVRYLIEDIPISYLSSASLLKTLREVKTRRTDTARYPLLAFAHPVYEASPSPNPSHQGRGTDFSSHQGKETNFSSHQKQGTDSSSDPNSPPLVGGVGGGGNSLQAMRSQAYRDLMRGEFAELPETAEEVEEIARLLSAPQESEALQLREDASRSKVFALNINERLNDYHYLIFASHGVLPGEVDQIAQPALVLSHPDKDGYLTMADVFQLQLNAKLVVLSACNTGSGEQVRGEGVMGLTRAFMFAGTPAIAVTLWSVESFSAKALDIGLFRFLKDGQPPAQALRSIKLRMLRGKEGKTYRHPYYWAPFVVFGDGM